MMRDSTHEANYNLFMRRLERYHDKSLCFHQWQLRPKDVFRWHCPLCGAWSQKWKPRYSNKGAVFRGSLDFLEVYQ